MQVRGTWARGRPTAWVSYARSSACLVGVVEEEMGEGDEEEEAGEEDGGGGDDGGGGEGVGNKGWLHGNAKLPK